MPPRKSTKPDALTIKPARASVVLKGDDMEEITLADLVRFVNAVEADSEIYAKSEVLISLNTWGNGSLVYPAETGLE